MVLVTISQKESQVSEISEFCVRYILSFRVTYEYFSSSREDEIVDQNVSVEFADIR